MEGAVVIAPPSAIRRACFVTYYLRASPRGSDPESAARSTRPAPSTREPSRSSGYLHQSRKERLTDVHGRISSKRSSRRYIAGCCFHRSIRIAVPPSDRSALPGGRDVPRCKCYENEQQVIPAKVQGSEALTGTGGASITRVSARAPPMPRTAPAVTIRGVVSICGGFPKSVRHPACNPLLVESRIDREVRRPWHSIPPDGTSFSAPCWRARSHRGGSAAPRR